MKAIIDDFFPQFSEKITNSIRNERSEVYGISDVELVELESLSSFREDQVAFEEKMSLLCDSDRLALKNQSLDVLMGFYKEAYAKSRVQKRTATSLKLLTRVASKDSKICELGSNAGGFTSLWFYHSDAIDPKRYTVCDIVPDYCRALSMVGFKGVPINLTKESTHSILGNDYDLVVMTEIVEHMSKKEGISLISDGISLIKEGGCIMVSYPRDVGVLGRETLGHHSQPDTLEINNKFSHFFKSVEMDFDGSRTYHLFRNKISNSTDLGENNGK